MQNPYSSLFYCEKKVLSLPYAVGLLVWSLNGSDEAEWLSYYHPNVKNIFPDASHLSGSFGKRIFNYKNHLNQANEVVNKLRKHPTTRRTSILISEPNDHKGENIEFPCAIATQYFIRDNKLHSITFMRAQSAMAVMPYDVFLFMNIQIFIANQLGLEVGCYTHNCGTIHIYEDEILKTKEILNCEIQTFKLNDIQHKENWKSDYDNLFKIEKELRQGNFQTNTFVENSYLNDLAEMLLCYNYYKTNKKDIKCKFETFYSNLIK